MMQERVAQQLYSGGANARTVAMARDCGARTIAEIGIYEGHTSRELAALVTARHGTLHLFDYQERVDAVTAELRAAGNSNIVGHGNSARTFDSYNWSLMRLLERSPKPILDYAFLDGAHLWHLDALAFCLLDRLLVPGGYIDFDDYWWNVETADYLNPRDRPAVREELTDDQIQARHVQLVVDLLVRRNPRYVEIITDKVFRKLANDGGTPGAVDRLLTATLGMARWGLVRGRQLLRRHS